MAPTKPSKRPSLRSKTPRPSSSTTSTPRPTTKPTKKAKLLTRKTTFLSKIEKASTKASARSRRRKNKALQQNLVTELDSLADALDDVITSAPAAAGGKSIGSRPGAMKRKEAVVRDECERFGKNLAIMQAGMAATQVAGERPSTWVALRGFIEGTMERKEEFVKAPAVQKEGEEEMVL